MNRFFPCTLVPLTLLALALLPHPAPGQEPSQPASPEAALPAPKGLAIIDQGENDKRLAGWKTPAGFKLDLLANRPTLSDPVALAFAEDGSLWVLERTKTPGDGPRAVLHTFKYKDGSTRQLPLLHKKSKDRVKILRSSKNDGVFDSARVVLEEQFPSALLLHDGWLYLAGQGTVRRYKPSRPDGPYDVQEMVVQGFSSLTHPAGQLCLGNDGWLYIAAGRGDHFAEGSDGSRATVLHSGAVFRCRPDGAKLELFATGLDQPGGGVFDLAGNLFLADALFPNRDRIPPGRLLHVLESADYGANLAPDAPGRMPHLGRSPVAAPTPLFLYNDTRLPEEYRGLLLHPDPRRAVLHAYRLDANGATFKLVEGFDLLSHTANNKAQPCQAVLGPDGGVYVLDQSGCIYRLSWSGTKDQPALPLRGRDEWSKIRTLSDTDLVKTLSSDEAGDRFFAQAELRRRGEKNRKALLALLKGDDVQLTAKIAALGVLQTLFDADVQTAFQNALKNGDSELQRLAAEALGRCSPRGDRNAQNALLLALSAQDLAVRRAVALAMGRLAGPGAADNLATALSFDDSKDVFLRDGLLRALERLGQGGVDALLSLAESGVQKDTDRVVEAFTALRSRAAFAALPKLLDHRHVGSAQRVDLVRSAVNYRLDPPVSLDSLVAAVAARNETTDVNKALLHVLLAPGLLTGPRSAAWLTDRLTDRSPDVRLEALRAVEQLRPAAALAVLTRRLDEEKLSETELRATVHALTATPQGARLVGRKYLAGKLSTRLRQTVIAGLKKHPSDPESAKLLASLLQRDHK